MNTKNDPKAVFAEIFKTGSWKGQVPSGPGSTLAVTERLRPQLAQIFVDLEIRSLCDAPCGDITWITSITGGLDRYFGVDIVEDLIAAHQVKNLDKHEFSVADVIKSPLPNADAILCRDCLVHLPLEDAVQAVNNMCASGAKYLILTTFPAWKENRQARMGGWRPLNLQLAPFNFPPPLRLLAERKFNPDDKHNDKSMGVWEASTISDLL